MPIQRDNRLHLCPTEFTWNVNTDTRLPQDKQSDQITEDLILQQNQQNPVIWVVHCRTQRCINPKNIICLRSEGNSSTNALRGKQTSDWSQTSPQDTEISGKRTGFTLRKTVLQNALTQRGEEHVSSQNQHRIRGWPWTRGVCKQRTASDKCLKPDGWPARAAAMWTS